LTAHKGDTWAYFQIYDNSYSQFIVKVKAMQQEMTADASQLQSQLDSAGHVRVYGIHFETGKAEILPDSEAVLNEILKQNRRVELVKS
jgi:outer membrane protein OmpA-like peptidoglycan-associated protein